MCWRSNTNNLKVNIEDGKFVLIKGKITTYAPQSKYQLIVDEIEYQGEGELLKILEERKKLLAEGLFDLDKKKKFQRFQKILESLHLKQELFLKTFYIELMIGFQRI